MSSVKNKVSASKTVSNNVITKSSHQNKHHNQQIKQIHQPNKKPKKTKQKKQVQIIISEDKPKRMPSPSILLSPKKNGRRRSSSAIELGKKTIYAGPTFNNAPEPSLIPLPATLSPTLVSIQLTKRDHHQVEYLDLEKSHHRSFLNYSQFEHYYDKDLSEIQRDLRSLLKI